MLSTRDRDHDCLSLCKELELFIVKALSNLSLKIRIFGRPSYRRFRVTGISLEIATFRQGRHEVRMHEYIMRAILSKEQADNKFQIFEIDWKNDLNQAIVEKSPCIKIEYINIYVQ